MIYSEDRDQFLRDMFRPPFAARMTERLGPYIDGLQDKDAFMERAFDEFYAAREKINSAAAIVVWWEQALRAAAMSRPRWLVHCGPALERTRWIPGRRLGRAW